MQHSRFNSTVHSAMRGRRQAVTLVELLIVLAILTLLATLSVGTLKTLLSDQKVSNASRLVEQYLESARVRAITTQRPVAVFLERTSIVGDTAGNLTPANFYATRLSIGEVFPPYTGDLVSAKGTLVDVALPLRPTDGYADQIVFNTADVASGFGTATINGFLEVGDVIEFDGHIGRFAIESITFPPNTGTTVVTFFNPPASYNANLVNNPNLPPARSSPSIPVAFGGTDTVNQVGFRAFRTPTKSLVGAITLPKGTCVDLGASGFGNFSASGGAPSIMGLAAPPAAQLANGEFLKPSNYSRVGILFDEEGRLAGVVLEDQIGEQKYPQAPLPKGFEVSDSLFLMVGSVDRVMPGDLSSAAARRASLLTEPPQAAADQVKSNLLAEDSVWIMCNPFSGEIRSAPTSTVTPASLTAARTNINDLAAFGNVVAESRALASSGVRLQ